MIQEVRGTPGAEAAMGKPNLFEFATKELSQDAFICWLLTWAHPRHRTDDEVLHRTGRALLEGLLAAGGSPRRARSPH